MYDVVIVGAGTAGVPCAIAAAERGLSTLVVEKDRVVGGTLHVSGGHMSAAGTRLQRSKGIVDSPAEHFEDIMRMSRGTANADIVRLAVEQAAGAVDRLESMGLRFTDESPDLPTDHESYSVARSYQGVEGGMSILNVLMPRFNELVEAGAITLKLSTPAVGVTADADRVNGVRILTHSDEEVHVAARNVVLASGGYGSSPEIFARLHGVPLFGVARGTSTGDGVEMLEEVGGHIWNAGSFLPTFGGFPDRRTAGRAVLEPRPVLNADLREPTEIYVTSKGERFVAEDSPGTDVKERALGLLPDQLFWMIFDRNGLEAASGQIVKGWNLEELLGEKGQHVGVRQAESLAELAVLAGIDKHGLSETVAAYNSAALKGRADAFGRVNGRMPITVGPFLAIPNCATSLITFGGIAVSNGLEVLRRDGSGIGGLYALGEIIGNGATAGNAFCSGMQVTPAVSLGFWLGSQLKHV